MISFIITYWFHLAATAIFIAMWSKIRSLHIDNANYSLLIQAEKQTLYEAFTELKTSDLRRIQLVSKLERLETENFDLAFENEELKDDNSTLGTRCSRLASRIAKLENDQPKRSVPPIKPRRVIRRKIVIRRHPNFLPQGQNISPTR